MKIVFKLLMIAVVALSAQTVYAQKNGGCCHNNQKQQKTVSERAKNAADRLKTDLQLTDKQHAEMVVLKEKMITEREAMRNHSAGTTREDVRLKSEKMRDAHKAEMKKILTEEQYTKWESNCNSRGKGMCQTAENCPKMKAENCPKAGKADCPKMKNENCPREGKACCPNMKAENCPKAGKADCPKMKSENCPKTDGENAKNCPTNGKKGKAGKKSNR